MKNSNVSDSLPPNVLLISVDTLRKDHVGLFGYERNTTPHIDAWLSDGLIFENAYSVGTQTPNGVVGILSGMLAVDHKVRNFYTIIPDNTTLISEYLAEEGYQTAAVVSNFVLTREAMGLDKKHEYFDDVMENHEAYRPDIHERIAENTTNAALLWSYTSFNSSKPYFLWVHYQDPHVPYGPPLTIRDFTHQGEKIIKPENMVSFVRHPGLLDGLEYIDLYDEEIAYFDHFIGILLEKFEKRGLLKNTVIIFTSDHGEIMLDANRKIFFTHGREVYNEQIAVPLVIKFDKLEGSRISIPVSTIDILPTVLNLTNSKKRDLPGVNLIGINQSYPVFAESWGTFNPTKTMILGNQKWIYWINRTNHIVKKEYYDLELTPIEIDPMEWEYSPELKNLDDLVKRDYQLKGNPQNYSIGAKRDNTGTRTDIDDETLKKLRALGYLL